MMIKSMIFIFFFLTFSFKVLGFVDMKNSNYSDAWIDYRTTGAGYQMLVQRNYSSRSNYDGIFGFGWCTSFETKIEVLADNSIRLTECGGGQEITYVSGKPRAGKALEEHIREIISLSRKVNPRLTKPYIKKLRKDLKDNLYLRQDLALKLGIKGSLKEGLALYARGRGGEKITWQSGYYKRHLIDGTFQKFNSKGRLISIYDRNSNYLKLVYAKDKLTQVIDNQGVRIDLKYHTNEKVKQINASTGQKIFYTYKGSDMVQVKNAWGEIYKFEYDKLHNLTKATFPDKTTRELAYNPDRDLVLSFKGRSNCIESYTYQGSKEDPRHHYWSFVKKYCKSKIVNQSKYEFWHRAKSDGTGNYLYRVSANNNNHLTDVTYHDIFGKPLVVKDGRSVTWYTYDSLGFVKEKKTPLDQMIFSYDPYCKKISSIFKKEFQDLKNTQKVTFQEKSIYQYKKPKCHLSLATSSKGLKVKLGYDQYGRINKLIDQAQKYVTLAYDSSFGKPHVIQRPGLGAVKIIYDGMGKVKDIKSKQGTEVATQVISVFNNLIELVSPVTESLSI